MASFLSRYRPVIVLGPLLLASYLGLTAFNYLSAQSALRDEVTGSSLPLLRENIYSEIQKDLGPALSIASAMAHDSFLVDWIGAGERDLPAIVRYLDRIRLEYGYVSTFFVSAATGRYYHFRGVNKVIGPDDPHDVWYYGFVASGEPYALDVDSDEAADNRLTIFVNYRVQDAAGRLLGVTGVGLEMQGFSEFLRAKQAQYLRTIYLVDSAGLIQAHSEPEAIQTRDLGQESGIGESARKLLVKQADPIDAAFPTPRGIVLLSARYLPELDWYLIVQQTEASSLEPVRRNFGFALLIGVLASALIILASAFVIGRFNRALERQATTDALTGLGNRHTLQAALDVLLYRRARSGAPAALIMMDVDFFKRINDSRGHQGGDAVLAALGRVVRSEVRAVDHAARWGGDEICVAVEGDAAAAAGLAGRIAAGLRAGPTGASGVTLSAGVAALAVGEDADGLLRRADRALYRAKAEGRDRIVVDGGDDA
jgi:diguanylate cyclase (GGDEF)-like protein